MWPFTKRPEVREAAYTDALVRYLVGNAEGGNTDVKGSGALEIAAGIIGRSFASAVPVNAGRATPLLTPDCLQTIGREIVRTGECVFLISAAGGILELLPVHTWEITGSPRKSSWVYRLDLAGPTEYNASARVAEGDVVSVKWAVDPSRPWCGISPLTFAHLSGQLHVKVVEALRDEAGGPRGTLLPIPKNPDKTVAGLAGEIKDLKGGVTLVERMDSMWQAEADKTREGWNPKRLGAAPGQPLVDLHTTATRVALACCGIPAELADAGVDATSRREAWRQFLHGTLAPLGRIAAAELRTKLELPADFGFDWTELAASDTQGRARAFGALAKGGVELERALTMTGFTDGAAA